LDPDGEVIDSILVSEIESAQHNNGRRLEGDQRWKETFREISFPAIAKEANVRHQATSVTKGFDLQRTIEVSSRLTQLGRQRNSKFRIHEPVRCGPE
jgi:hypothetical protein